MRALCGFLVCLLVAFYFGYLFGHADAALDCKPIIVESPSDVVSL